MKGHQQLKWHVKTVLGYVVPLLQILIASLKNVLQGQFHEIWCFSEIHLISGPVVFFFQFDNIMTISHFLLCQTLCIELVNKIISKVNIF